MTRIAVAGFQHETNTFSPERADLAAFEMADSWPGLLTGGAVISGTLGMNIPIAGFVSAAAAIRDVELCPILWCAAEPCGPVTDHAFNTVVGRIIDGLETAGELDGVYLDLHGAMVTESFEDGEGEVLRRLRSAVGDALPIIVSLDMHANVTPLLVQLADSLCIFRTYPHLDMAETGARCVPHLMRQIARQPVSKAFRQVPFLIPMHAQHTGADPARALYAALEPISDDPAAHAELAMGFPLADTRDTGPSISAIASTQAEADRIADAVLSAVMAVESDFEIDILSPASAVERAMSAPHGRPIVIADVQDNPGAGGTSDTTGLLHALVDGQAKDAILGLMYDQEIACQAHTLGIGAEFDGALSEKSAIVGQRPFVGTYRIEALSEGLCTYTGEMYGGGVATLGPSAVLRVIGTPADVQIVVTSVQNQCLDLAHFTHFGLDPRRAKIVCVKSTAHFRADFEPIAEQVLLAAAPGLVLADMTRIGFRHLRKGMRFGPLGPIRG